MVRLRRVERRFAAAESLRRITRGLLASTPLKSGSREVLGDAGIRPGLWFGFAELRGTLGISLAFPTSTSTNGWQ